MSPFFSSSLSAGPSSDSGSFDLVILGGEVLIFDPTQGRVKREPHLNIGVCSGKVTCLWSGSRPESGSRSKFGPDLGMELDSRCKTNPPHLEAPDGISGRISSSTVIIEASGLTVLPGVIDSQVHFREPGYIHKETIETGSRASALGGVTTFFEMPNTEPPTTTEDLWQQKMDIARESSWVNYAFFVGGSSENVLHIGELEKLPGCPGVKIFMGSSTGSLLVEKEEVLDALIQNTRRPLVVHSEDEDRLRFRKTEFLSAGRLMDVQDHPLWRDEETAFLSTQKLIRLVRRHPGRKVHVLHVTTSQEMDFLKNQKDVATVEVLPQHLTLWAPDCYERWGTLAQQNPPIRNRSHYEALWKAVQDGTVDVVASDHAPHTLEEKGRSYPRSPSGMPGTQTLLPLMLHHVHQGRLSLERLVELVCENPARIFGCSTKGRIELGRDADFTLVDLKKEIQISNAVMATRCGWTPFDGMRVHGWPLYTIVNGKIVMREGELLNSPLGKDVNFDSMK